MKTTETIDSTVFMPLLLTGQAEQTSAAWADCIKDSDDCV
jgi:hypothetical protein